MMGLFDYFLLFGFPACPRSSMVSGGTVCTMDVLRIASVETRVVLASPLARVARKNYQVPM